MTGIQSSAHNTPEGTTVIVSAKSSPVGKTEYLIKIMGRGGRKDFEALLTEEETRLVAQGIIKTLR